MLNIIESLQYRITDMEDRMDENANHLKSLDSKQSKLISELSESQSELRSLETKITKNGIDPKKCKHEWRAVISDGTGYSGRICSKCNSLGIFNDLYDDDPVKIISPEWPFKPECSHKDPYGYHDLVSKKPKLAPLNVYGHYCKTCGHCFSVESSR